MPPELHGRRLTLRPLAAADEPLYCAVYSDAGLMAEVGATLGEAAARRAFAAALRANAGASPLTAYWVLVEREHRSDIGLLGLLGDAAAAEAEVGAIILPAWHSRGYAAEAIALLVDHAFSLPSCMRLHTRHTAANAAAIGLMEKLGFSPVATAAEVPPGYRWELHRGHWQLRRRPVADSP